MRRECGCFYRSRIGSKRGFGRVSSRQSKYSMFLGFRGSFRRPFVACLFCLVFSRSFTPFLWLLFWILPLFSAATRFIVSLILSRGLQRLKGGWLCFWWFDLNLALRILAARATLQLRLLCIFYVKWIPVLRFSYCMHAMLSSSSPAWALQSVSNWNFELLAWFILNLDLHWSVLWDQKELWE